MLCTFWQFHSALVTGRTELVGYRSSIRLLGIENHSCRPRKRSRTPFRRTCQNLILILSLNYPLRQHLLLPAQAR